MKRFVMVPLVFVMGLLASCYNQNGQKEKNTPPKQEILVLHAGSLALPFQLMTKKFTELNPDKEVKLESHGSLTCARQMKTENLFNHRITTLSGG